MVALTYAPPYAPPFAPLLFRRRPRVSGVGEPGGLPSLAWGWAGCDITKPLHTDIDEGEQPYRPAMDTDGEDHRNRPVPPGTPQWG